MLALDVLSSWPARAAAGVVRLAGSADAPAGRPTVTGDAGPVDEPFFLASVTKLCTALAVLVAVEERTLSLDEPAGPPGSTVAHLLAHASGLGPSGRRVLASPGQRRIYSNANYELLGELLAERAGIAFATYLTEAVLEPLAMDGARLPDGGSPAAGMTGSVGDLLALAAELLRPTIVAPETLARATTVAFPGLSGVVPGFGRYEPCDWGLGPELKDAKQPHWTGWRNSPATFGHFGRAGGFLWVDPRAGVACAVLSDREFGPWAGEAWPALADSVLLELSLLAG
ncbi:MAG: serine hydrolase domain-containing protein [Acidimicrobiales bacterium]